MLKLRNPIHRLFLFAVLMMVVISVTQGCAQFGVPQADTFNKKLLEGYATVQAVAKSAGELRAAGKLSNADRENIVATNQTALAALDLAGQVHKTDAGAGDQKLAAAITILQTLQAYLATQGAPR